MFVFGSRRSAARLSPPSYRRGLRMEWLEDRTTPSTFFVDDSLVDGASISTLNAGNFGFQVTDQDGDNVLGDGDRVSVNIPGLGSTDFTFRTALLAGGDNVAYTTLSLALAVAPTTVGTDDVYIGAGTYGESLVVNSSVNLIGTSATATDVKIDPASGVGVTITAADVGLKNLQITGSSDAGLVATNVIDLTLDNVQVTDNGGVGLNVQGSGAGSTLTLTNVTVSGNADGGGTVNTVATIDLTAGGSDGATITASGTSVQVSSVGTSGQVIDMTGVDTLDLTGTPSGDTFVITPPTTGGADIHIAGGAGTDVIDLTNTDGLAVAATPGANGFGGTITSATGPTIDFTGVDQFAQGSTISGTVVVDADGNGVADPAEPGIASATVFIDLTGDGTLDAGDITATTDATGGFAFTGLPPLASGALYSLLVQSVAGTNLGSLTAVSVAVTDLGAPTSGATFAADLTAGGVASGVVFNDLNGNGQQNAGENPVAGARVYLDLNQNATFDAGEPSALTGADGVFNLATLTDDAAADIRVVLPLPGGFQLPTPFTPPTVSLTGGATVSANTDIGLSLAAGATGGTVTGVVFGDQDGDGQQDPGEAAVPGVLVYLDLNQNGTLNPGEPSVITGADGSFTLTTTTDDSTVNLQIATPLPAGFGLPSPFTPATLSLTGGASLTHSVGVRPIPAPTGGTVTGIVYGDLNNNGVQNPGENGVSGVTVYIDLTDNGRLDPGEPIARTNATGGYTLSTTQNGTFAIRAVLSPGYVQATGFPTVALVGGAVQQAPIRLIANLPPQAVPPQRLAAGFIQGGQARVQVFGPNGAVLANFPVFVGLNMRDVRVAVADVTGDGVEDVIVATGPGVATQVIVLDGTDFHEVARLTPFESTFTGGVYVATGDLTGDGIQDLIVTPDEGGGPRVLVYRGGAPGAAGSFEQMASFLGIEDPNFRGGARTTVADINRDGTPDLVVAAGFGGGPRVAVYDGRTVLSGSLTRLFNDFFIFEDTLRNGAFIAAGDIDGDGFADLIGGGGPGGGPRILALSGVDLMAGKALESRVLGNFFAGDSENRGGVRVTAKDLDGDGRADVITGSGPTFAEKQLRAYRGDRLDQQPEFEFAFNNDDQGGVFVG